MGPKYMSAASTQRISTMSLVKPRGEMLDRNSIPLTNRSIKTEVVIQPLVLRSNENDLERLAEVIDINPNVLKRQVEFKREPILFNITNEQKQDILELNIKGTTVLNTPDRYTKESVAKHVLGYTHKVDQYGVYGLEKVYESVLKRNGENSIRVIADARDNLLNGIGCRILKADNNKKQSNLKLTIDYHIQKIVEKVMEKNNIKGAVVIEEVLTGDIIAIASKPDFDPEQIGNYLKSSDNELFNRAVASYNIGSIFKIVDAASFIETGTYSNYYYLCDGVYKLGDRLFKCSSYAKGGHGLIGMEEAFKHSCNSYFIEVGLKLGHNNILNMAHEFGLGNNTGLMQQGIIESTGNIPTVDGRFTDGDIANISIGQGGILTTPVQIANLVATVANGGIRNQVNLVDSIVDTDGRELKNLKNTDWKRIISKSTADRLKELMQAVVDDGTGTSAKVDGLYGVGGKTGSAETGLYENGEKVVHAWFAGYFPGNKPKYSVAVFVENGKSGGQTAAPIFKEILEEVIKIKK